MKSSLNMNVILPNKMSETGFVCFYVSSSLSWSTLVCLVRFAFTSASWKKEERGGRLIVMVLSVKKVDRLLSESNTKKKTRLAYPGKSKSIPTFFIFFLFFPSFLTMLSIFFSCFCSSRLSWSTVVCLARFVFTSASWKKNREGGVNTNGTREKQQNRPIFLYAFLWRKLIDCFQSQIKKVTRLTYPGKS